MMLFFELDCGHWTLVLIFRRGVCYGRETFHRDLRTWKRSPDWVARAWSRPILHVPGKGSGRLLLLTRSLPD